MSERRGLPGLDGLSAFEIACADGFRGTEREWLESLKGARGEDGESVTVEVVRDLVRRAVDQIPRPVDGAAGKDGLDGKDGARGPRGPRGERGTDGTDAHLPPVQSARAQVFRDPETRLWLRVHLPSMSVATPAINLFPVRGADQLIEYVDLVPEPM